MQPAETELQNTIELRATASESATRQPDLRAKTKDALFLTEISKENQQRQN